MRLCRWMWCTLLACLVLLTLMIGCRSHQRCAYWDRVYDPNVVGGYHLVCEEWLCDSGYEMRNGKCVPE